MSDTEYTPATLADMRDTIRAALPFWGLSPRTEPTLLNISENATWRLSDPEAPGDLCYYAPWGNLALFHGPYRWSRGLYRLGRLDAGPEPLLTRGKFPLRIERAA